MNKTNLPTSRNVFHFSNILPVGVEMAQTVVHFDHFQVQASDGWVKNRGRGWYSVQYEIASSSGQNKTHLGDLSEKWAKVL